jgi:hypothetical protein
MRLVPGLRGLEIREDFMLADPMELDIEAAPIKREQSLRANTMHTFDTYLRTHDYASIIKDQNFFWLAYCKVFNSKQAGDVVFSLSPQGGVTSNQPSTPFYSGGVKEAVERIRKLLVQDVETKQGVALICVKNGELVQLIKDSKEVVIDPRNDEVLLSTRPYNNYVFPCLPDLAALLGIQLTLHPARNQKVIGTVFGIAEEHNVEPLEFTWRPDVHLVYPIPPQKVAPRESDKEFYSLYKEGTLCDLTLRAADGALLVHQLVLYAHGGAVLQNTLKAPCKEAQQKEIVFPTFSKQTIELFVEFLYLGEKGLQNEVVRQEKAVDLCELFVFAHTYQIEPLIASTSNLISLFVKDADTIKQLGCTYANSHLKELYVYLTCRTLIKV